MKKRWARAIGWVFLLGFAGVNEVWSAPITQPSGLAPGTQYRLAFLTSTGRDATSDDIEVYNTFVTNVAGSVQELSVLNTTWKAIASTAAVDARDNTGTRPSTVSGGSLGVRIFLLNDTLLTQSNDSLWNTLQFAFTNQPRVNENGDVVPGGPAVWTGTATNGTENGVFRPLGYSSTPFSGVGRADLADGRWLANGSATQTESHPLYALSGVLTIPTPALEGDLDLDGFVGISDLNLVLGNWNQTIPPGDPAADPSDDNFVGIDDLNTVLGNWNAGAAPAVNTSAIIPEPATAALLMLGALALGRGTRQR